MSKPAHTTQRIALPLGAETKLLALTTGPLAIGEDRVLPTRLLAMPWGVTDTNKGRLTVNEVTLGVLAHNQAAAKFDRIAFDFQHNTVNATPADEPIKVAGWGTPEIVAGEGIYLSAIEYTADGPAPLLGGHYPDLSPTLNVNAKGEVVFIHSLAAVRQGEVDGLTLFTPAAGSKSATALAALSADGLDDFKKADGEPDWRGITIAALNAAGATLDDDAQADDILAAASQLSTPSPATTKVTMSADPVNPATETRLVALEANAANQQRQIILSAAKHAGKVIPLSAESIAKLDPATLQEIVDALPANQVPLNSETEGADDISLAAGGMTAADHAVAKQLNLSAEDFKKYGV